MAECFTSTKNWTSNLEIAGQNMGRYAYTQITGNGFKAGSNRFTERKGSKKGKADRGRSNPIQISVYEDKIYIWNDGEMPSELDSTEKLFEKHSSKPYNPKLANVFFKSGMIEAWGRGFDKMKEACVRYDALLPEYTISPSGIMVLCKACDKYLELLNDKKDLHLGQNHQYHDQDGHDMVMMILDFCKEARTISEIMEQFGLESRTSFRRKYLNTLVKAGKLKMTLPDKPKSKNQKYYS